jgi:hypothetical protein
MLPEQKEKTREEIVRGTGWGFLVAKSSEQPKINSDQKPATINISSDAPPPETNH